ncbi:hypothetical protein AFK16_000936 [Salmonella enterica subsp. enterica]|nr:hypothetical protein [Salmonella enterica subsp. enterica]
MNELDEVFKNYSMEERIKEVMEDEVYINWLLPQYDNFMEHVKTYYPELDDRSFVLGSIFFERAMQDLGVFNNGD